MPASLTANSGSARPYFKRNLWLVSLLVAKSEPLQKLCSTTIPDRNDLSERIFTSYPFPYKTAPHLEPFINLIYKKAP